MRASLAIALLVACNMPATRFTGVGDDGGSIGDAGGSGSAPSPASLAVSPAGTIGLGTVVIGRSSSTTTITVSNDGDLDSGPLTVTFNEINLGFATSNDTCKGRTLAGHHTCTFDVTFTPTIIAAVQTNLQVTAAPGGDVVRLVSGSGLLQGEVNIIEESVTFPNQSLGAAATTKVFTIENAGQVQIGAPKPSISGTGRYTIQATTCTAPLNQTDTCTVTVAFTPTSAGAQGASLVVTSTPGGEDSAQLSGTAFARVVVNPLGGGGGTITSTQQPGISCPNTCTADFINTPVTLTAAANGTSTFAGWGGDCSGTSPCTLNLNASKTVSASFSVNSYPLTVAISSSHPAPITITSSPAGINCDGITGCTASFQYNSTVTLSTNPDPSSKFVAWNGGVCPAGSTMPTCTFGMPGGATSVGASFEWFGTMTIFRNQAVNEGETVVTTQVRSNDNSIDCTNTTTLTGTCTTPIRRGQTMTLTYSGAWNDCPAPQVEIVLIAQGRGDCAPPDLLCSNRVNCATMRSCQITFDAPSDYTSGYNVVCERPPEPSAGRDDTPRSVSATSRVR
jgi:hypothetical protein